MTFLGIRLTVDANPPGLVGRREQADVVHARCCGYVGRRLESRDWVVQSEVEVGRERFRGWIDLLAFRPRDGTLLVIEVKTEVHDVGRIQRTMSWYQREAWNAARRIGWRPRSICAALLILDSAENQAALLAHSGLFRLAFPARAADLASAFDHPLDQIPQNGLAMIDPRSRRGDWLRATRADGRRSPAPYRDYRDAAAALARGSLPAARSPSGSSRR
jgi:hypothetical protein